MAAAKEKALAEHIAAHPEDAGRTIFEGHIAPWMARFFADLERAEAAEFYQRVGTTGRIFIEIEAEAFALPL